MLCTVAAIVSILGYMPPPGTEIVVPRSQYVAANSAFRHRAERCATKYKIKWRIDESR
jgi:hypothetical protein